MVGDRRISLLVLVSLVIIIVSFLRTPMGTESAGTESPRYISNNGANRTVVAYDYSNRKTINDVMLLYKEHALTRLRELLKKDVSARDPEVVSLVRDLMDPPSKYKIKNSRAIFHTPQSTEVVNRLGGKRGGFFIEVGGLDGERSSNTLILEARYGWTGLLIEMDPYYYMQLRGKSRHSWSINACVSTQGKPMELTFSGTSGRGHVSDDVGGGISVPCFPLESMLLAINVSHVDYWSLDVEGVELDILRTIPWDTLDITMLSVEYAHGNRTTYTEYMEQHGYTMTKVLSVSMANISLWVEDLIFVQNNAIETIL